MSKLLYIPSGTEPLPVTRETVAHLPPQPLSEGVQHIPALADAIRAKSHEAYMAQNYVRQAFMHRRWALHKLRIGDRLGHRFGMQDALYQLKHARQWRPKV